MVKEGGFDYPCGETDLTLAESVKKRCRTPLLHLAILFYLLYSGISYADTTTSALEPDEITPPLLSVLVLDEPFYPFAVPAGLRDITRGPLERPYVSITFDGGAEAAEADAILKALDERGIKATIFLTGIFIKKYPDIARRIVDEGHEVGNHTLTHPHLTDYANGAVHKTLKGIDREFLSRELNETANLFKEATGAEMIPLWRAPYGEINDDIRRWAYEEGYLHIGWTTDYKARESLDTLDWVYDKASPLYLSSIGIKNRVVNFGKGRGGIRGGIILMHLGSDRLDDKASESLAEMLDEIMDRGYRLVPVSRLIESERTYLFLKKQKEERVSRGLVRLKQ